MTELKTREEEDNLGAKTGIESSDDDAAEETIAEPFDPEDIDVITRTMTVDLLISRAASGMINLQPEFQRRWGIWDDRRQSRLIESLLLRIPLPVLYAAEDEDERWEIVDGIQRLSTITRFINPRIIGAEPLALSKLEYLTSYNGKTYSELPSRLQLRLRETELLLHLIRKGTPAEVKFNVFARINTGGVSLSPQELRHAITPGKARGVLEKWASSSYFLQATTGSVRTSRMDDRELVLRFIAFFVNGVASYRQPDMDGFLLRGMKKVNETSDADLVVAHHHFEAAMWRAAAIFGDDAFRKRFEALAPRKPLNKALFETVSVNLALLDAIQAENLVDRRVVVQSTFMELCRDRDFEVAISQGTNDVAKVNRRFQAVKNMFEASLG